MTFTPRPDPPRGYALVLLTALALASACSDHGHSEVRRDPERQRRVIDPPPRGVRALPPHAIRADGVGPYRLGARLSQLLDQLPSGPRIAQLNIPGVVHRDILRAEEDAILIGGEPQDRASFVGVIGAEVARTESDIHVGSTRDEVIRALGAPIDAPDRARDPRLVIPSGLPNLHVVLDGERVIALVVTAEGAGAGSAAAGTETPRPVPPREGGSGEGGCKRPNPDADKREGRPTLHLFGTCLAGSGELAGYDGDELAVFGPEKAIASTHVPGLVFAAPLRAGDGRDELVTISRVDEGQTRTWMLAAYRLEGARLVRSEPAQLYKLTAANARWIGAELGDLDLYLELTGRHETIEVGGLLTTRIADKLRDIVVISPVSVTPRWPKVQAPEPLGAGPGEAGSGAHAPEGEAPSHR